MRSSMSLLHITCLIYLFNIYFHIFRFVTFWRFQKCFFIHFSVLLCVCCCFVLLLEMQVLPNQMSSYFWQMTLALVILDALEIVPLKLRTLIELPRKVQSSPTT